MIALILGGPDTPSARVSSNWIGESTVRNVSSRTSSGPRTLRVVLAMWRQPPTSSHTFTETPFERWKAGPLGGRCTAGSAVTQRVTIRVGSISAVRARLRAT